MIYIVNGLPTCGKSTFEFIVQKFLGINACRSFSTIAPIKALARDIGWNGEKDPKSRKFLSDLKDLTTKFNDYSFNWVRDKIQEQYQCAANLFIPRNKVCIFVDSREPEDIQKYLNYYPEAKSLLVIRPGAEPSSASNHADDSTHIFSVNYDITIFNDGDIPKLEETAKQFIENEKLWRE